MAQRWRVGESGLRVITARGTHSLPAGVVLDELPDRYEGTLEVIEWKSVEGYADKMIRSERNYSDKGQG